jgi:hypothetical protein
MGSPRDLAGRAFAPVKVSPTAVPRRFYTAGSSSLEPASPSERGDALPAFDHLGPSGDSLWCRKRLPWGSDGPSSRHQPAGATYRRERPLSLLRSVLGVPPALDGLLPDRPCGFVSPRSRVQGSRPSGVSSSSRSSTGFSRPMPSCRCSQRLCGCPRQDADHRLQGLAPRDEYGDVGQRVRLPDAPFPSRASSSSGCSLSTPRQLSPPPPTVLSATNPLRPTLGVLLARSPVCLESGYRPARGFRPELHRASQLHGSRPTCLHRAAIRHCSYKFSRAGTGRASPGGHLQTCAA